MSLTSELQDSLEYLISSPDRPQLGSREVPASLSREAKRYVVRVIENHPEAVDPGVVRKLNRPYGVPHALQDIYSALMRIGVEDADTQTKLMLWFLGTDVLGVPESVVAQDLDPLTDSDKIMVDVALGCRREWLDEDYALFYAVENHLCYYGSGGWHLTGLGRALLRLSVLQGTRFLLSLEVFLNAGKWDEWHMSESFLQRLHQEERLVVREHSGSRASGFPEVWVEYAERVVEFGLAGRSRDRHEVVVTLTKLGRLTIRGVLDRDSALDSLIPIYIREEMIGGKGSDFASEEDVERICRLVGKSKLVGELKEPILREIERLRRGDAPFLSVFKALAPCVEGIVRNVTRAENVTVRGRGLGGYVKALEETQLPVLKPVTLQMIDEVFRPYRNIVEHGHVIGSEPARMMCEACLWVIEQIHADYVDFKE